MRLLCALLLVACEGDAPSKDKSSTAAGDDDLVSGELKPPGPDQRRSQARFELPAVPAFQLPPPDPDGARSVKELRVRGGKLFDQQLVVKGYVTWVYDCVAEVRQPGMTEQEARKTIENDPTQCERPKFYIGDTADTSPEHSLWVVEVPRPFNKLELERIRPADRTPANFPLICDAKQCPPYAVGDSVTVTGTFTQSAPHGDSNSDGLLVYGRMRNASQNWESTTAVTAIAAPRASDPPAPVTPPPTPIADHEPARIRAEIRDASTRESNAGAKALGQRQWDTAAAAFEKAIKIWPENHLAWHGLASAHAQRKQWGEAARASESAVKLVPDAGVYRETYGWFLFEEAVAKAREAEAKRRTLAIKDAPVDLGRVNLATAEMHLVHATKLDASLWRAHYLLGRIREARDDAKAAAESYTRAVAIGPMDPGPWLALANLYRAWGYTDQAIQVAEAAALAVAGEDAADVWFTLGMGYSDKRLGDKAIAAFDKALEVTKNHAASRFQRGQEFFRRGNFVQAKADLTAYLKTGTGHPFYRTQASRMLRDIEAKRAR